MEPITLEDFEEMKQQEQLGTISIWEYDWDEEIPFHDPNAEDDYPYWEE